jgi:hypothetical protein
MSEQVDSPTAILQLKGLIRDDPTLLLYLIDFLVDLLESKDLITEEEKNTLVKETVRRWYLGSAE